MFYIGLILSQIERVMPLYACAMYLRISVFHLTFQMRTLLLDVKHGQKLGSFDQILFEIDHDVSHQYHFMF